MADKPVSVSVPLDARQREIILSGLLMYVGSLERQRKDRQALPIISEAYAKTANEVRLVQAYLEGFK